MNLLLKKCKNYLQFIFNKLGYKKNWRKEMEYDQYLKLQIAKTSDEKRIHKWKTDEWDIKLNGFIKMFKRHKKLIENSTNSLCLGSRTGQEVAALQSFGIDSIGVDLVAFPPYTVIGDIHNLPFHIETFDLAFSNIYDHILYPEKFAAECFRVLKNKGILILHVSLGFDPDEFSVNYVYNEKQIIELFNQAGFNILNSNVISNEYDSMNFEFIFEKKVLNEH
jgi:SAM-dependent methyltransferase